MFGLIFFLFVVACIGGIAVMKLGWKQALTAAGALALGIYAGGQQMWDALSAFFGSVL